MAGQAILDLALAVMCILRKAGLPKDIEVKVVGESLFNDGVGATSRFRSCWSRGGSASSAPPIAIP